MANTFSENDSLVKLSKEKKKKIENAGQEGLHPSRDSNAIIINDISVKMDKETETDKKSVLKFFATLSSRRKYTLILVTNAVFLSSLAFSLMGPFYATTALEKGMDIATVGVVYGIFELVIFLTAPLFGTYLLKLGPRFVILAGIFVGGCCNILFGTVEHCPSGVPFIVISILVRSVEALGFSGFITSGFAIVSSEFSENVGFTFGILETGSGLGFMLGPTIGGALFQLGGFGLPFFVAGITVLTNGVALYILLPPVKEIPAKQKGSMLALMKSPLVTISLLTLFIGLAGIATFDASYADVLKRANFSIGTIGVLYSVLAFLYSVTSFIWGYLSESKDIQSPLIIAGHFVFGVGFLLLGPSDLVLFLPFNLVTILIGLTLAGVSIGCHLVPTMKCMIIGALEIGFEDNIETYALVSGLFTSVQTLGTFVGPVSIGYLVKTFGYPFGYTVVGVCSFVMMVVTFVFFAIRKLRSGGRGRVDIDKAKS